MEFGDEPHDVEAEPEMRFTAAIAVAHGDHRLEELARHRLRQARTAVGNREHGRAAARLEADADGFITDGEVHRIGDQLVEHLRVELGRAAQPHGRGGHIDFKRSTRVSKRGAAHHLARVEALARVLAHQALEARRLAHAREDRIEALEAIVGAREINAGFGRQKLQAQVLQR